MNNNSIYGALAYIADFYGMTSAPELLRRLGLNIPRVPANYDHHLLKAVIAHPAVDRDLKKILPDSTLSPLLQRHRAATRKAPSKKVRACKLCLAEGCLHQETWQQPFYTHCEKHHVLLIDSCEHIYTDASWPEWLRCKHCITEHHKSALPHYLQYYFAIPDQNQAQSFIGNLIQIAERMIRPFDFIAVEIAWERLSTAEISQILDDAFMLSAAPSAFSVWSSMLSHRRSALTGLGKAAQEYGFDILYALIDDCEWQEANDITVNIEALLERYHRNINIEWLKNKNHILQNDTPDKISNRASNWLVTELLDIDARALPELVQDGILPVKKPAARTDKLIFDIHDVDEAVKKIFSWPLHGHIMSVSVDGVDKQLLDALLLDRKLITKHVLTGKLKAYWAVNSTSNLINRTTLSAESLTEVFEYELANATHLPIKQVAEFLGIRVPGVKYLVENQYLRYAPWQRDIESIDIQSLQTLMKRYICLNREAILKGVSLSELIKVTTACCGVTPCVNHVAFKDSLRVVLFEKSAMKPCCIQAASNQLEALNPVGIDLSKKVKRFANAF